MEWFEAPPTKAELKATSWDNSPPTPDELGEYSEPTSLAKQVGHATVNALPQIGGVVGGFLGTPADLIAGPMGNIAGAGIGGYLGASAKNAINSYINPDEAPKSMAETLTDPLKEGAIQAAGQGAGELAAPVVSKAIGALLKPSADALATVAEKRAVESTGATGAQVYNKFKPGSGKELLDRGIVKFGNSQASVAKKATAALDNAGKAIGDTIDNLTARGAVVDQADIINSIRNRAQTLSERPSQFNVADHLNKMADRMQAIVEARGGNTDIPLKLAEEEKKAFASQSNYLSASPSELSVTKELASIYRQAVENSATQFDPSSARIFQGAKQTFSVLAPIAEAAEKRAATLAQSPKGGLMDTVATGVGAALGGTPGAIVGAPIRRMVSTRIAPSIAATANTASNALNAVPKVINRLGPMVPNAASSVVPISQGLLTPQVLLQNKGLK